MSRSLLLLGAIGVVAGCVPARQPIGEVDRTVDLRLALSVADADVVGVSVDHATGERYVLDAVAGLYRLTESGAELVLALSDFPAPDVAPRSGFTDLAAMGQGRFALLSLGDGYLLDLEARTLQVWFCYEPGWMDEEWEQSSHNLGYDPASGWLFSHIQTEMDGALVSTNLGVFDGAIGGDIDWETMEQNTVQAGGLAVLDDASLLLGAGAQLYRYDRGTGAEVPLGSLAQHGISDIAGLAALPSGGVLVIDAGSDRLLEIELPE